MNLFVFPNLGKSGTRGCLQALAMRCGHMPFELLLEEKFIGEFPEIEASYGKFSEQMEACHFVVAIGGDGTILQAVKASLPYAKPVLGINTGRLGFLSSMEVDELDQIGRLLTGQYALEERMLLEVETRNGGQTARSIAFNDAAVMRGGASKVIDVSITCDGKPVGGYTADGVVFSTPSGSTAYALSAGGPIVDPALFAIEVTPLCAHSLFARSILFSSEKRLCVTVPRADAERSAYLAIDGDRAVQLTPAAEVWISAAAQRARLVNLEGRSFYEVLDKKILSKNF